jgi:segregation and condensation protein A
MSYSVTLPRFEGPLDLLLFFVQRDEIDIFDIPIARVTDEFLAYVRALSEVDLDGAAEFIYFAALLISIKARALLPTPPGDEAAEPEDPRRELAERLLEYVRFKEAARQLGAFADARALHRTRPVVAATVPVPEAPAPLSLADLVRGLRRVLVLPPAPAQHAVKAVRVSVGQVLRDLFERLGRQARVAFVGFVQGRTRPYVVAAFLGVLEGVRRGRLRLRAGAGEDFFVERRDDDGSVPELSDADPTGWNPPSTTDA